MPTFDKLVAQEYLDGYITYVFTTEVQWSTKMWLKWIVYTTKHCHFKILLHNKSKLDAIVEKMFLVDIWKSGWMLVLWTQAGVYQINDIGDLLGIRWLDLLVVGLALALALCTFL